MAYQNFMCNKDFHPSNIRNLKKMYEAEQRQKQEDRRQEELRQQYIKEQEIYKSKELVGKANPLNFMYEPPPGLAKDGKGGVSGDSKQQPEGEGEPKLKFDWQRSGRAAPREEYAKDMELRDKPFGIEVRNVKCIKCGKWGHVNTDRLCPLYGKAKPVAEGESATPLTAPLPDLDTMEDGLIFKQCVRDRIVDDKADNQQILLSDDEDTQIGELLSGLSKRERKRVLRKLAKSEGSSVDPSGGGREIAGGGQRKKKRKHGGKKKKKERGSSGRRKRGHSSESSESESESESEDEDKRKRKKKVKKQRHKKAERRERSPEKSGSSSWSESDQPEHDKDRKRRRKIKHKKDPSESDELSDLEAERDRRPKHQRREGRERYCNRQNSGHSRQRNPSRERDRSREWDRSRERSRSRERNPSRERQTSRSGGSGVKREGSHYERGRTHYDRDRKHYHYSSDGDKCTA